MKEMNDAITEAVKTGYTVELSWSPISSEGITVWYKLIPPNGIVYGRGHRYVKIGDNLLGGFDVIAESIRKTIKHMKQELQSV